MPIQADSRMILPTNITTLRYRMCYKENKGCTYLRSFRSASAHFWNENSKIERGMTCRRDPVWTKPTGNGMERNSSLDIRGNGKNKVAGQIKPDNDSVAQLFTFPAANAHCISRSFPDVAIDASSRICRNFWWIDDFLDHKAVAEHLIKI